MAIYTYGVDDVAAEKHGMVRTTNLRSTYAGHQHDVVHNTKDLDNGMNVKLGDHITSEGRECVEVTFPSAKDQIVLVADVVKIYDTCTTAQKAEYNYYIKKGVPARAYDVELRDKFGISTVLFSTKVGDVPAEGNYVVVDGNGGYKELASTAAPTKTENGFIGKIYGYDHGDNETIVLIDVLQNVQL